MLPLGLPFSRRRAASSVRTISLPPPDVFTNQVLDNLIQDIVEGTTKGFDSLDAEGSKVRVFLHFCGFLEDYPASSQVADTMKHMAEAPCTHCSFRQKGQKGGSSYAYTTKIHYGQSSFTRNIRRTLELHASNLDESRTDFLGMKEGGLENIRNEGRWPLIRMSLEL